MPMLAANSTANIAISVPIKIGQPARRATMQAAAVPSSNPINPPTAQSVTASVRN